MVLGCMGCMAQAFLDLGPRPGQPRANGGGTEQAGLEGRVIYKAPSSTTQSRMCIPGNVVSGNMLRSEVKKSRIV